MLMGLSPVNQYPQSNKLASYKKNHTLKDSLRFECENIHEKHTNFECVH